MNQRNIIISLIVLLITSFSFLAYTENNQHTMNDKWFIYFENPQDNSLNFIIENTSDENSFLWSVSADSKELKNGEIEVLKNTYKTVRIERIPSGNNFTVQITQNEESKEIYKNF